MTAHDRACLVRRGATWCVAVTMLATTGALAREDRVPGAESGGVPAQSVAEARAVAARDTVTASSTWTLGVAATSTTVRKGPRSTYAAVRVLAPGKPVEYSQVTNGWGRVREGEWVRLEHLRSPGASRTRWTLGTTNVRFGPSTGNSVVGRLSAGTRVTGPVVGGWQRVGDHRWVSTSATTPRTAARRILSWPTGEKVAYLTFDDGPHPRYTPQVLDVLDKYDVPATFFVVGSWAKAYPGLVARTRAEGHKVSNHSWNHPELWDLTSPQVVKELTSTQAVIGGPPKCFRPPYGATNDRVHEAAGSAGFGYSVLWSAGGNDWQRPGEKAIVDDVVNRMTPGGIALMHDGGGNRSQTVGALDDMIRQLRARGYTFRTLPMC